MDRTVSGERLRVAVMGGSLGGLTAALLLRDAGHDVQVYERSRSALGSRGAGIVSHELTLRYLVANDLMDLDEVSTRTDSWRYVDEDGTTFLERRGEHRFTSWNSIHKALLSHFDPARYHLGAEVVDLAVGDDEVDVVIAGRPAVRCDLLVCADGISSTARTRLLPGTEPRYAGYVGWRGTVHEADLTPRTRQDAGSAIIYRLLADSHILTYPIPNHDGDVRPGHRLINFVWYRNVPSGPELDALMTDTEGARRTLSVPPGHVRPSFVEELREAARSGLPAVLAEVVTRSADPFLQVIVDLESPRMAFGRACLLGDAAFAARPHAAAGTAKAAADAWALSDALVASDGDVASALARWEPGQLELGRALVGRSREIGDRSQFEGNWDPFGPTPFGLYGPGR
jgi:2,6-dihydroxypyridine 3-monooxygenase